MLIIPKISRLSRSTNGSNKKRWKKDNSVQITFATFSDLSPLSLSRSRFLSPSPLSSSFPSPFQLLFIPRLLVARLPSLSVLQPVLVRQSSLTKRGREGGRAREGIWNWGKPLMRRSCKSPVKVTDFAKSMNYPDRGSGGRAHRVSGG